MFVFEISEATALAFSSAQTTHLIQTRLLQYFLISVCCFTNVIYFLLNHSPND